jgi:hypothetical protein
VKLVVLRWLTTGTVSPWTTWVRTVLASAVVNPVAGVAVTVSAAAAAAAVTSSDVERT